MSTTSQGASLFQTLLAAGVGALIANFGAEFVKSLVRRRQTEELSKDEDLAAILTSVDELQELAIEFWSSTAKQLGDRNQLLRAHILAKQQHVLHLIAHLFTGNSKRKCDVKFTAVITAVAGGDFDTPTRSKDLMRLSSVLKSCLAFRHLAQRCRRLLPRGWLA